MTKKHFIALAATIKNKFELETRPWASLSDAEQTCALCAVDVVVQVARQDNPMFDECRFRAACGVPA